MMEYLADVLTHLGTVLGCILGGLLLINILVWTVTKTWYAAKMSASMDSFRQLAAKFGGQHDKEDTDGQG